MKEYKKIKYVITTNPRMGFPLAYIKVPENHPFMKIKNYNDVPLDVHGGVTFMADVVDKDDSFQKFDKGRWIGWDYGHAGDWDYIVLGEDIMDWNKQFDNKMWTFEEVEKEVKAAIRELLSHSKKDKTE
jgi:hypothetical protein